MFIGLGLFFLVGPLVSWIIFSHHGYGTAAGISVLLAGSLWLVVLGITRMAKKTLPVAAHLGILGGLLALFTALGPTVGTSYIVSHEKSLYKEYSEEYASPSLWEKYQTDIPEKFRSKDWRLQWMKSRVRDGLRGKNAGSLRAVANECADAEDSELLSPAREEAVAALTVMYDEGKKKMFAATKGSSEFPVDNALREAFGALLTDLARAKDGNIYVAFENTAKLEPPKDWDGVMKLAQSSRPGAKVIGQGNAFSPTFDKRRRATFMTAMSESFGQVFDGQLLTLVPLEKDDSRKGKIVLEVKSNLYREADLFEYTNDGIFAGFLFSFLVDWNFELFDRKGKSLYKATPATSKPSDAKFDAGPGAPDWAPYSVMMDSAYYNYSREVTGRFGLTPPPKKAFFTYEGAAPPPP